MGLTKCDNMTEQNEFISADSPFHDFTIERFNNSTIQRLADYTIPKLH